MTTESYIRIQDIEPGIALLTITREHALNALNAEVLDQLYDHLQALAQREDLSALVITGTGRAFVAGADIKSMLSMDLDQAGAFAQKGHRTFNALAALPYPTIAALNGFTLGGGLELAVSCDLIYASTKAKLGLPEVGLGLIPGFGGTQRLGRLVGYHVARELIFTGRTISADQAKAYGIALELFEPDALEEGVLEDIREGDVGAILGWGFAPWSGGPFSWLDIIGAPYAAERCDQLTEAHGPRFTTPDLLREMADKGQSFYGRFGPQAKAA